MWSAISGIRSYPRRMGSRIWVRRVYDPPTRNDGHRVLVDRLWPRGITREHADVDEWIREIAPSDELRRWFAHEPARWEEFSRRYRAELKRDSAGRIDHLLELARTRRVTLVFGARDRNHNNAVVLRELLEERLAA